MTSSAGKLGNRPMYRFLMVLTICSAVGLQAWRTLFDNFSVNVVGLDGWHIGVIQSVREIPGFLALLVVFIMLLMKEHRISSLSILILGLGVGMTGLFPSYFGLIGTTVVMSLGFHYYETTFQSLTLQYFDEKTSPIVFGKLRSVGAASNIAIGTIIFLLVPYLSYKWLYLLIGAVLLVAGVWSFTRNPTNSDLVVQRKRMIFRGRYWLFYFLTFMAGARRQIFVAFAVFLLVKKFEFSVQEITALFVVNNIINYFLSPMIGRAIVRFGERKILSAEYFSLVFIFVAYAVVESKYVVVFLYIADHIFFNFAIAIRTFFQKIGDPRDVAPTMAVGFTINHIGAVVFPVVGGLLWMIDYRIPFVVGAVLSVISLVAVQLISGQVKLAREQVSQPDPIGSKT
ncbi:MAG: MFS transporter [Candidatus Zixiibacteriota bacterium]|nr:MAG: MFS transporter [candidate division Zixibacteria bacterium]